MFIGILPRINCIKIRPVVLLLLLIVSAIWFHLMDVPFSCDDDLITDFTQLTKVWFPQTCATNFLKRGTSGFPLSSKNQSKERRRNCLQLHQLIAKGKFGAAFHFFIVLHFLLFVLIVTEFIMSIKLQSIERDYLKSSQCLTAKFYGTIVYRIKRCKTGMRNG